MISHGEVKKMVLSTPEGHDAYVEAFVRRRIATKVQKWCDDNELDFEDFSTASGLSRTQRKRLLNIERGGALYLSTLITMTRLMKITIADLVECDDPTIDNG